MTDREVCALAIKTFGKEHQLRMLQEECSEVVVAVNHLMRGRIEPGDFLSECADVEIMILQAREIYGDEVVDQIKATKIKYLLEKIREATEVNKLTTLSERGKEWASFASRVADYPEDLVSEWPDPERCMKVIGGECMEFLEDKRTSGLQRIALYAWLASGLGNWNDFANSVANHIENYTVPQYGDKGKDYASTYTPEYCISQIMKYRHRFGTNARGGQQFIDFMKIAHFACLADAKACTKLCTVTLEGEIVTESVASMRAAVNAGASMGICESHSYDHNFEEKGYK